MPYEIFHPNLSKYDTILYTEDGVPLNDVNFVQTQRAEVASLMGSNVSLNENFSPPLDDVDIDSAFDSFVPKTVQSTDELLSYNDFLNGQFKNDKNG